MVRVQRLSGMRSCELVRMRGADIDRSDPACWTYVPSEHKTEHHDRGRVVFLGPRAQETLTPYLLAAGDGYLFDPRRSEERRNAEKRAGRKTPRWPSHCKRKAASPRRPPGDTYSCDSYRRAIRRACEAFGVPVFSPHRLRHSAGTAVRRRFGLEAAQVVLGHAHADVSEIYAQRDLDKAREVMRAVG
jgi:integrase